jgi:hypothetical protein
MKRINKSRLDYVYDDDDDDDDDDDACTLNAWDYSTEKRRKLKYY